MTEQLTFALADSSLPYRPPEDDLRIDTVRLPAQGFLAMGRTGSVYALLHGYAGRSSGSNSGSAEKPLSPYQELCGGDTSSDRDNYNLSGFDIIMEKTIENWPEMYGVPQEIVAAVEMFQLHNIESTLKSMNTVQKKAKYKIALIKYIDILKRRLSSIRSATAGEGSQAKASNFISQRYGDKIENDHVMAVGEVIVLILKFIQENLSEDLKLGDLRTSIAKNSKSNKGFAFVPIGKENEFLSNDFESLIQP